MRISDWRSDVCSSDLPQAPLVFSIKQAGVPAGTMLAGLIRPLCVALYGWRAGLFVTAAGLAVLAVILQHLVPPLERNSGAKGAHRPNMLTTLRGTVRGRAIGGHAFSPAPTIGLP